MYSQANVNMRCPNHHVGAFQQESVFCQVCGARLIAAFQQMPVGGQTPNRAPQRLATKQWRWIGAGLMLGGFVFLLFSFASAAAGVLGVFLFLACFVSGFMMLAGFFGESAQVAQMRQEAAAQGYQNRRQTRNVAVREFRYKTGWFAMSALIVIFLSFFLAGLLFLIVATVNPNVRVVLLLMGLMLLGLGSAGLLYAYRTTQMYIKIDAWGLKAATLFGSLEMAWDEVVTLEGFDIRGYAYGSFGQLYKVYSLHQTLEFSQNLENYQELISIINYATQNNAAAYQER